jgi:twitching motility protein PilT
MQLFDQALLQAVTNREIDPDDAFIYASDKRLFQKFATETGIMPRADVLPPAVSQAGS